ncbi:MAG TPA: hypothetical protein VGV63_01860 [Acidimicrobiales bacterium]|nr:hypothetical protein [Acidimicrobiales bacterium]
MRSPLVFPVAALALLGLASPAAAQEDTTTTVPDTIATTEVVEPARTVRHGFEDTDVGAAAVGEPRLSAAQQGEPRLSAAQQGEPRLSAAQQGDLYDCSDFEFQEDAQAVYDDDPTDPYGLDGSMGPDKDDGIACKELPSRGAATPAPAARTPRSGAGETPATGAARGVTATAAGEASAMGATRGAMAARSRSAELAGTGVDSGPGAALGSGLVLLGAAMVVASQRRLAAASRRTVNCLSGPFRAGGV